MCPYVLCTGNSVVGMRDRFLPSRNLHLMEEKVSSLVNKYKITAVTSSVKESHGKPGCWCQDQK